MVTTKPFWLLFLFALVSHTSWITEATVRFTNLQCFEFDKSFASFKKCFLKARSRYTVSLHVHVALHQVPVDNVTMNAALFVKGNGYRPFMYNNTLDFCEFLKHPNRYMFWKIIYEEAKPFTNANHTCPIDHDVIVDNVILSEDMLKMIPFPTNEYMIQLQFAAYNHYKAKVKLFLKVDT